MTPGKTLQKIRLLPENTINQIAAGEVIESSGSVVKELVDNAIDAGAKEICVETVGGGRSLIRVQDDGCGMGRDDLFLALERHATSKISASEDLDSLLTLGFRGEALPAIASVSKMSISSAPEGSAEGASLLVHGGKMVQWESVPRRRGTTVEVRSLFYNVPVRKRFQKSLEADRVQIQKMFMQAALAFPEIKFRLQAGESKEIVLPAKEDLRVRIGALLGEDFAQKLVPIEGKEGQCYVSGFISNPSLHYPNRKGQHLFLNKRAVFSPFISYKILEGYSTRLPSHRFPLFVLDLTLPPEWVDVNVHPQKSQVRLREEKTVGLLLASAVERALEKRHVAMVMPKYTLSQTPTMHFSETFVPYQRSIAGPVQAALPLKEKTVQGLGQVGGYFLAKKIDEEELLLVDIRAARAQIMFEKMVQKEQPVAVQTLLFPLTLEFGGDKTQTLITYLEELNAMGVGIRSLGEKTFMVDSIPKFLEGEQIKEILDALITDVSSTRALERKGLVSSLCRSIRLQNLSIGEGEALVEKLFLCENPHESPLGKKTYVLMKETEIAKRFKNGTASHKESTESS